MYSGTVRVDGKFVGVMFSPSKREPMMAFFTPMISPNWATEITKEYWGLASAIVEKSQPGPQRTQALQKLLESRDSVLRAMAAPGV